MRTRKIILGGGCFWCVEAVYQRIQGVESVVPGYAGGHADNPTYQEVCQGSTGHAEVVEISYNPEIISLEEILKVFWRAHDPTTLNRQGHDTGTQYRSIILCNSQEDCDTALSSLNSIKASLPGGRKVVTELALLERFWPAEPYHIDYFNRNRQAGYCRMVIQPKLKKLNML